jgi:hypothetical protein
MMSERQPRKWLWLCVACYFLLLTTVVFSLFDARKSALQRLSNDKTVSDWQLYREDVRQHQSNGAVVERRVPKSAEPPALVLLRDYFAVTLGGAVLFSTVLFWVMAWLLLGAMRAPRASLPAKVGNIPRT